MSFSSHQQHPKLFKTRSSDVLFRPATAALNKQQLGSSDRHQRLHDGDEDQSSSALSCDDEGIRSLPCSLYNTDYEENNQLTFPQLDRLSLEDRRDPAYAFGFEQCILHSTDKSIETIEFAAPADSHHHHCRHHRQDKQQRGVVRSWSIPSFMCLMSPG